MSLWFFRSIALAAAAFIGQFGSSNAQNAASEESPQIMWRSESLNGDQLAGSMERLYLSLYNTEALKTKTVATSGFNSIEELLRGQQLFTGSYFPETLDAMMCDLNPKVCERAKIPAASIADVGKHVGGYLVSPGNWHLTTESNIVVPDYNFEPYTSLEQVTAASQDDLSNLSEAKGVDCSQWGSTCTDLIRKLNPSVYGTKRAIEFSSGSVIDVTVPVMGYSTALPVTSDPNSKVVDELLKFDPRIAVESPKTGHSVVFDRTWTESLEKNSPADIRTQALEKNLQPWLKSKPFSSHEPVDDKQKFRVALLANHPLGSGLVLGPEYKQIVTIAVFDNDVQARSCGMAKNISVMDKVGSVKRAEEGPQKQCGGTTSTANAISDHGTHVVGIISATPENEGVAGLNPAAHVVFSPVDTLSLQSSLQYLNDFYNLMIVSGTENRITNISWGYQRAFGDVDLVYKAMKALERITLYVVAAGNSSRHFDRGSCQGEFPACFTNLQNVIAVVGLDAAEPPKLWKVENGPGSDSSEDFHIAAVADSIPSVLGNGDVGILSGTSQAAPQVSAAASLLVSIHEAHYKQQEEWLSPERIKNRLMYTADIHVSLLSRVFSGKLNVEKAIKVADSYIEFIDSSETKQKTRGFVTTNENEFEVFCTTGAGVNKFVKWYDVNRMVYDSITRRYVLFVNGKQGDRDSRLERITDCQLRSQTQAMLVTPEVGDPTEIPLHKIRDYIAPMF